MSLNIQTQETGRVAIAAVARVPGGDFTLEAVHLDPPQFGELRVRIAGVGICHTDLVFRDQFVPFTLPAVLGHEGAGVVEHIGAGVIGFAPGDKVILSFSSCGECDRCHSSLPSYCRSFVALNYAGRRLGDGSTAWKAGGERLSSHFFGQSSFASHAIVRVQNLVRADSSTIPLELLGPLACGIQTGAGSVMRSLACTPGSSIAILGGGTVGLSAVMAAVIQGCARVVVVEPFAARRALALELGATHVIDPADGESTRRLKDIVTTGFDYVLDSTGDAHVIEAGLAVLGNRGAIGLVGVPKRRGDTFSANTTSLMASGARIVGITEGDSDPRVFIPELISLHDAGQFPFTKLITTFSLADINKAIALQARGDIVKAVLIP